MLALPLELRDRIYADVLLYSHRSAQFLRVCRQIYLEAQKFIFKRPLSFDSQVELYGWLKMVGTKNLHHVTSVSLRLQDIDLSPLLSSLNRYMPRLHCWDLYEIELETLSDALLRLSNIHSFTISKATPYLNHSYLYREFLFSFSVLVGRCHKKLRHMTLEEDLPSLGFLASMQNLRSFQFTGSSIAPPGDAAAILTKLPLLTELAIVAQPAKPATPSFGAQRQFSARGHSQSLTADVLRNLRPLVSFAIHEESALGSSEGTFFNPDFFGALTDAHRLSLRTLRLSLDFNPDINCQSALHNFLHDSWVQRLDISWPNLDPEILERLLPRSIQSLRVSVESYAGAFDILWGIIRSRAETPFLHEVFLVADWATLDYCQDAYEVYGITSSELDLAVTELRHSGIRTLKTSHLGFDIK